MLSCPSHHSTVLGNPLRIGICLFSCLQHPTQCVALRKCEMALHFHLSSSLVYYLYYTHECQLDRASVMVLAVTFTLCLFLVLSILPYLSSSFAVVLHIPLLHTHSFSLNFIVSECVCMPVCVRECVYKSDYNFVKSNISFLLYVGSSNWTRTIKAWKASTFIWSAILLGTRPIFRSGGLSWSSYENSSETDHNFRMETRALHSPFYFLSPISSLCIPGTRRKSVITGVPIDKTQPLFTMRRQGKNELHTYASVEMGIFQGSKEGQTVHLGVGGGI